MSKKEIVKVTKETLIEIYGESLREYGTAEEMAEAVYKAYVKLGLIKKTKLRGG